MLESENQAHITKNKKYMFEFAFLFFQVDIFQMYVLEFKERNGSPLYHLEHFIEGQYVKYNSNSGFVDENLRYTPQVRIKVIINLTQTFKCFEKY